MLKSVATAELDVSPAIGADIESAFDVEVHLGGTVYFVTGYSNRVYRVDVDGSMTLVAGVADDAELPSARAETETVFGTEFPLSSPFGLELDADDTLLITSLHDGQVYRLVLPDKTDPSVKITAPASIDRFGDANEIGVVCTDNRPGVTCGGSIKDGQSLDTSERIGSVQIVATDGSGNKTTVVYDYEVNWELLDELEHAGGLTGTIARPSGQRSAFQDASDQGRSPQLKSRLVGEYPRPGR